MKKLIVLILALAIMTTVVGAVAEDAASSANPETQQTQETNETAAGQRGPRKNRNRQSGTGTGASNEDATTGATPNTQQSQDAGEQGTGQKTPRQFRNRQPGTNSGRGQQKQMPRNQSQANGDQSGTQKGGQHRRMRGQTPSGKQPVAPETNSPAPDAAAGIDFDARAAQGVISQATCDSIKAYIQEHSPVPAASAYLIKALLDASVITQAEYDALTAAQNASTV